MAKRWIVAAVTVLGGLMLNAGPTSAATLPTCGYAIGGQQQTCTGVAQGIPVVGGVGENVEVSCTANSPATASVQATVVECYLESYDLREFHYTISQTTSGTVSTLTQEFDASTLVHNSFFLCVRAGFVDSVGNFHAVTNPTCNPLQLPGPLGSTSVA